MHNREDVLEVYRRPPDDRCPVVCVSATSKQLVAETRVPQPPAPGQPVRYDYEYRCHGVCHLFMLAAPQQGWRTVQVTARRTKRDFAAVLRDLVDVHFPQAKKVVLVCDNLNTHHPSVLYETFSPAEARRLAARLEWHYTPKHGSWLNIAASEFAALAAQCLDRRIASEAVLEAHFDCCQATVRGWLHQFAAEGLRSLRHQRRGLGPDVARRQVVRRALNGLLSQTRTWTAAQLAEALADKGLVMKPRTVRKYLKLMGARYVRTKYVLRHRQDPEAAAAARTELDDFKKSRLRTTGPLLPRRNGLRPQPAPTHTWCRRRQRHRIAYESPQGQRVNVMAVLAAPGTTPGSP
ncbi:MAG: transposase [Caldilineaceae bacterium]|nr:transposase [Caldilineaceae bacterium]